MREVLTKTKGLYINFTQYNVILMESLYPGARDDTIRWSTALTGVSACELRTLRSFNCPTATVVQVGTIYLEYLHMLVCRAASTLHPPSLVAIYGITPTQLS